MTACRQKNGLGCLPAHWQLQQQKRRQAVAQLAQQLHLAAAVLGHCAQVEMQGKGQRIDSRQLLSDSLLPAAALPQSCWQH